MKHLSIIAFFFLFVMNLNAQVQDTSSGQPIIIDYARQNRLVLEGEEFVSYFYGDVRGKQDSIFFRSDTMIKYGNDIEAWKEVSIQQGDSITVFSDSLSYLGDSMIAFLFDSVILVDRQSALFTEFLIYDMNTKVGTYTDGGLLVRDSAQLISRRGAYHANSDRMYFYDSVRATHPDFLLKTDSLVYDVLRDVAYFISPTLITYNESRIYTETGYYDVHKRYSELTQNPQYRNGDQQAYSDRMILDAANDKVYLIGNAHFKDSIRTAEADTIIFYQESDIVFLIGNAIFREGNTVSRGPFLTYDSEKKQVINKGRSITQIEEQKIIAEKTFYSDALGVGRAEGQVVWEDTVNHTLLLSPVLDFYRQNDSIHTSGGRPVFLSIEETENDTLAPDSLMVSADEIYSFQDTFSYCKYDTMLVVDTNNLLVAKGNTLIHSIDMQGKCDSLVYSKKDSLFKMFGKPVLWSDSSQITADTIYIYMANGKPHLIHAFNDALLVELVFPEYYNQVRSREMKAYLKEGKLDVLWALGNAENYYYMLDDEDAFVGLEKAQSSKIKAVFDSTANLDRLIYIKEVVSNLYPIRGLDPLAYRFDNFIWRNTERPVQSRDIQYDSSLVPLLARKDEAE